MGFGTTPLSILPRYAMRQEVQAICVVNNLNGLNGFERFERAPVII
jgi:hypothetical protein